MVRIMQMSEQIKSDVYRRLNGDNPKLKTKGGHLQRIICPACHKDEAWAHAENPWVIICGRQNACGEKTHIKDVYADLFESWSDRYESSETNPNAAADAYLAFARGFDIERITGWYSQGSIYKAQLDAGSATVRFDLGCGAVWERIIDRPHRFGKQKANFIGAYAGHWWVAPQLDLVNAKEIWITEGCFDTIALLHHDVTSVAALSCNNYPEHALKALATACTEAGLGRPKLIWALDAGHAGEKFTKEWVKRSRDADWEASAAQPPAGKNKLDWNDLHQHERLSTKDLEAYRHNGAVLIATSALDRAVLLYQKTGASQFHFSFDNNLFWWTLDTEKLTEKMEELREKDDGRDDDDLRNDALLQIGAVKKIANCFPQALYFQQNKITDESWYYYRISFPHDGGPVKNTFTASQLASGAEFKKRLLGIAAGAIWLGTSGQLDRINEKALFNLKTVETIDFIGYSREYSIYVLGDLAVKSGKLIKINDEDYFESGQISIKSLNRGSGLQLNPKLNEMNTDWPRLLWQVYGVRGYVALLFWFGSFFAEQIRAEQESFPFLEITGEAGSGKTSLLEFLWKLAGRPGYEGFDPLKSTSAGLYRNLEQFANLPVVLIEGDRDNVDSAAGRPAKSFEWDSLKTAFNGRSIRARGLKNSGNETYEPPFRGTVVIAQNADVQASEAILTRIVHIHTDRAGHRPELKPLADRLSHLSVEDLSGFMLKALLAESEIMATFLTSQAAYELELRQVREIKTVRIQKNHAQLMALADCLGKIIPISDEHHQAILSEIRSMAIARQQRTNADHPTVAAFWELYEYLETDSNDSVPILNHSRDGSLIAINLNLFEEKCSERRLTYPALADLKQHLRTSQTHKFIDIKSVNSAIHAHYNGNRPHGNIPSKPSTVKCWVFQK